MVEKKAERAEFSTRPRHGRVRRAVGYAMAAAGLVATVAVASPANAGSAGPRVWGPYYFKSAGNGQCLTGGNNVLYTDACGPHEIQRFYVLQYPSGFVSLKNKSNGRCVDVDGTGRVYVNTCNSSNYQGFIETEVNQGYYSYRPVYSSTLCLGPASAGRLTLRSCVPATQWKQWKTTPPS